MKKTILISVFCVLVSFMAYSQENVKWYTIEEAEKLMNEAPKPLFIDTYTDWCGWCKRMDSETFSHEVIANILNNDFYAVKFDAETKDEVTFLGQKFVNDGSAGKAHQLAITLLQGNLAYPTVVILTPKDGKLYVTPIAGYK
ncbi:MAG: DUF255 domain-containing protein, partial [Bacteroidales bacterium]|nr:DUF255 domain-containing protein [Bacteroidales bacterium]